MSDEAEEQKSKREMDEYFKKDIAIREKQTELILNWPKDDNPNETQPSLTTIANLVLQNEMLQNEIEVLRGIIMDISK